MGIRSFKFFQPNQEIEWWQQEDVTNAMDALNNVRENNILYDRIQFLEDQLVNIRNENTQLNIEMARLRRLRNNL
jgi:hypothetical protein